MNRSSSTSIQPFVLDEAEQAWTRMVVEKVRALRFGKVQLKIHETQVVFVEVTEQTRFESAPAPKARA